MLKKMPGLLAILVLFLLIPVYCTAESLHEVRTELADGYRLDMTDENGNTAFSVDRCYATLIHTVEGNTSIDRYYDEQGNPTAISSGYYGRRCEKLSDDGKSRVQLITYLNAQDEPMCNIYGYAQTMQTIEGGHCVQELYYGVDGSPTALYMNHYGYRRSFNDAGQVISITYLNSNGNPAPTNRKYTTVKREYDDSGRLWYEWYYDADGNPTTSVNGEYGTKRIYDENGELVRQIYLNKDGSERFVLTVFLSKHIGICVLAAILLSVVTFFLPEKARPILLGGYIFFIFYMTLLTRESGSGSVSTELFRSYREILTRRQTAIQILDNILLFIPFAAIAFSVHPTIAVVPAAIILSSLIEAIQLIGGLGYCEVDDIVSNGLGGVLGWLAALLIRRIRAAVMQHHRMSLQLPGRL